VTTRGLPGLRPYQAEPARAILDSVINQRGLTFTVRMSRQAGKNELSAQLETALLSIANAGVLGDRPRSIVKTAPTLNPQARMSMRRLTDALRLAHVPYEHDGPTVRIGDAFATVLSAEPNANVVGNTAGLLLEVDEAQDVSADKYDKEFRPMCAAFNATTVLYGTAWSDADLLERERRNALTRCTVDGIRRAFDYDWLTVSKHSTPSAAYVLAERDRLGPQHPLFYTQYELRCVPGAGRLFSPDQLAQLHGEHPRRTTPPLGATIVAGLDLAGAGDNPDAHDRTVLTLGTVTHPSPAEPLPTNHAAVLHHITWRGTPHDALAAQILDLINNVWKPTALSVDATGLGETIATLLARGAKRTTVTPVKFSRTTKSALGYGLLAAVDTGRLKVYAPDDSEDVLTFWSEARLCRAQYLPGQVMAFSVEPTDGHDDYVTSLALFAHAAATVEPRVARGRSPIGI